MGAFKLIIYPYAFAVAAMCVAMLSAMAAFGFDPRHWDSWQNELISTIGTIAGIGGVLFGLWTAMHSQERASK